MINLKNCSNMDFSSVKFSGLCDATNFKIPTENKMWIQLTVDGTICVPNEKPCIAEIDSINSKIEILSVKPIEVPGVYKEIFTNYEKRATTARKLIIEGLICFSVSYVSVDKSQTIHSFHGKVPFSSYIILPSTLQVGTPKESRDSLELNFMISSCIENICIKSVINKLVDLSVTLMLVANPIVTPCTENYLNDFGINCGDSTACLSCSELQQPKISGVCSPEKIRKFLTVFSDKYWNELSVPEVLTIPCTKPNISQILSLKSSVEILCQKVIRIPALDEVRIGTHLPRNGLTAEGLTLLGKKIVIQALLHQRITYVSDSQTQSVHSATFNVPISTYIMAPKETLLTDKFKLTSCIEDIYVCILNERQIFKNTTLFFLGKPITCPNKP